MFRVLTPEASRQDLTDFNEIAFLRRDALYKRYASSTYTKSNVLYRNCTVHPQHVSQMKVRAFYVQKGQRKFGSWSNVEYITPSPTKLTNKNASSGVNLKMNISWNIIYGCNGYNVFITTNPNGTWYWNQSTSVNAASNKAVITKFKGS